MWLWAGEQRLGGLSAAPENRDPHRAEGGPQYTAASQDLPVPGDRAHPGPSLVSAGQSPSVTNSAAQGHGVHHLLQLAPEPLPSRLFVLLEGCQDLQGGGQSLSQVLCTILEGDTLLLYMTGAATKSGNTGLEWWHKW